MSLKLIECSQCDNTIKPNKDIMYSGWMKYGFYYGPGHTDNLTFHICPDCWEKINY